jgi:tetratricopeptide (TPR) repeat protein
MSRRTLARRAPLALLLAGLLLALPACQMNERMSGTMFGAAGGALIGGLATTSAPGVLIGGAAGALAGYLIGDYLADQRERGRGATPIQYQPQGVPPAAVGGVKVRPTWSPALSPGEAAYLRGKAAYAAPEARAAYLEAVSADPRHADAWNALGLNYAGAGEPAAARAAFERALQVAPGHAAARANLERLGGPAR